MPTTTPDHIREQSAAAIAVIRNNQTPTPDAKRQAIAAKFQAGSNQMTDLQNDSNAADVANQNSIERVLFGLQANADGSTTISYRGAEDRVAKLTDQASIAMLDEAVAAGDDSLARALLEHAY